MFTGIVEGTAPITHIEDRDQGRRLIADLGGATGELAIGDSVAINGTCLTVVEIGTRGVAFDLAGETLRVTNLGSLEPGDPINFERAMRLGDRIDGHLVQGHVDGVGEIRSIEARGDDVWLEVAAAPELLAQCIHRGSITVDGISLTIAQLGDDSFACTIIPHSLAITRLGVARVGDLVNLEVDMVGKWLRRLAQPYLPGDGSAD